MILPAYWRMFVTMICLKINIHGKVYKTGLRYFLKQQATRLKIKGSVYYQADNSVGIIAVGEKSGIDELVRQCHFGNKDSQIESVSVRQITLQEYASFEVMDGKEMIE